MENKEATLPNDSARNQSGGPGRIVVRELTAREKKVFRPWIERRAALLVELERVNQTLQALATVVAEEDGLRLDLETLELYRAEEEDDLRRRVFSLMEKNKDRPGDPDA